MELAILNVKLGSVVVFYDHKYLTQLKYNLNHVYINFWIPFFCKLVFKTELRCVMYHMRLVKEIHSFTMHSFHTR